LKASFLALKALLKKSMLFSELTNFKNCTSAIQDMPSVLNTRSLAALVAIKQNVFLASSLRAGYYNLWSRHH